MYFKNIKNPLPELLVSAETLKEIKNDPNSMFNLSLTHFNRCEDDLLYLGRLHLNSVIVYSKIEPYVKNSKIPYNVKIEYFIKGLIPQITIKAFSTYQMEVMILNTTNRKQVKRIIRICNQQSDHMITNQLISLIQVTNSKRIAGRTLMLNFERSHEKQQNLKQHFVHMLICNETLLQKFVSNRNALIQQEFKNGIKAFKGIFKNYGAYGLEGLQTLGHNTNLLLEVRQFDLNVETVLYFDPINMIHGNKNLSAQQIKDALLQAIRIKEDKAKQSDQVKIWKINILDFSQCKSFNAYLSLHDLVHFYQSDLPFVYDLNNDVTTPNLHILLGVYLQLLVCHRSLLGRICLWKLPQYQRSIDKKTGKMIALQSDQMFKMQVLDVYKTMLQNVQQQVSDEINNALPLSLDKNKKASSDHNKLKIPKLCLKPKSARERSMPIFENNSQQVLKITSEDMQVITQRPKIFNGLKKLQFAIITVILHPSIECWVWQLYFPKTQRTFSITFYSSDLYSLDDNTLNNDYILESANPNQALWVHLINICKLTRNPIGDIMLQIENFKDPLKEILFQDIVYNLNNKDIMFMEVVIKDYSNYVTDVETPFSAITIVQDEVRKYTFSVRAYSLTRNIWIKDFQPLAEVILLLKRENYFIEGLQYFYYTMLKDTACLMSHKIVFSDQQNSGENKKRRMVYDIKSIIGRKRMFNEVSTSIAQTGSPKKERAQNVDHDDSQLLAKQTEAEAEKMKHLRNKQDWERVISLNQIIYQAVLSQNPVQMATVTFNEVKDVFLYRLYRAVDCSIFERQITANDVIQSCAPNLRMMMQRGLKYEIGKRIAQHYLTNILVASVLEFYKIK